MNILSVSFGHDGSAAAFADGRLLAAIAAERITRVKKQRGVTPQTIDYVLQKAGLAWSRRAGLGVRKAECPLGWSDVCRDRPAFAIVLAACVGCSQWRKRGKPCPVRGSGVELWANEPL